MKRILALLLAILMLGSLAACTGEPVETEPDTQVDINELTEETAETEAETDAILDTIFASKLAQAKKASIIYKLETAGNDRSERILGASMQGLAAKLSDVQIFYGGGSIDKMTEQIERVWDVPVEETMNGEPLSVELMLRYYFNNGVLSQYVLCSSTNSESFYVGVSLGGVLNAVVATEETKAMLDEIGYTCVIDVTDKTDAWLRQSEYWGLFNRKVAFEQTWDIIPDLFDYCVLSGSYINFYNDYYAEEHQAIYEFLDDNAVVFGWNNTLGEMPTVQSLASANISLIPSDYAANLSTLSGFRLESAQQKRNYDDGTDTENVHTVTFIYTDGDNIQYIINAMQGGGLYGSELRGTLDLGWGVPANMLETIPPMATYLYESMTERDEFVVALGSIGYTFPSRWSKDARATMTEEVAEYMRRTDLRYMLLLDDMAWDEEIFADYTEHNGIDGLFYVGADNVNGYVVWTNGKPTVGCRSGFTGGYEGGYNEILRFLQRKTLSTDVTKTRSYSMYYVGCWCTGVDVVSSLAAQLPDNVEVVTPSEFMDRMVANCSPAEE